MVRRAKSPKSTRKNKKTLKAKKISPKRLRKNKTTRNKKTRRNVKKHRRYGGAPPTDEIPPSDEKKMPQKVEEEVCSICHDVVNPNVRIKTNCGHSFHKKCLGLWCSNQPSDTDKICPMCRANIASLCKDIEPINSLGIMRHLETTFVKIKGPAGSDVESKKMENNRIIHEYLDDPTFDPNVSDSQNKTPLYVAVERSRYDVIDKLLKHPDINIDIRERETLYNKTPLELAIANRNYTAIDLFKSYYKNRRIPIPKGLVL